MAIIRTKFTNLNAGMNLSGTCFYKSAPDPPPPPDYVGAANATAAGNLDAARAQTNANRVNQITPYGQITYTHDPNTGNPDSGWTQTQTLAPDQQTLLNQQNATSIGLGNLEAGGLGYVNSALAHPVTLGSLPASMVNPGQTGQDALMARFQPQIEQSKAALTTQLANQGINPGSEAWNNAMRTENQSENDLRMQAALHGIGVGEDAQNQQMQLQTALQNEPLNILNSVRTGAQVTNPNFTNYAQQGQTSGPDLSGAATQQNQYNLGLYNSGVASANAGNSAAMSAAGTIGTGLLLF